MQCKYSEVGGTQRRYARLAGFLFLWVLALAFGSGYILSRVAGDGTFAETAARIAASERSYRGALVTLLIGNLSSVLPAFALYATLKPVNGLVALLAMVFNLADAFLGLIVRMCGFVSASLHLRAHRWNWGRWRAGT